MNCAARSKKFRSKRQERNSAKYLTSNKYNIYRGCCQSVLQKYCRI